MNFVSGALPNVMFLIGVMAIGIGLGLEFKIVEIKGQLSRGARFGAMGVGALLVSLSVFLYLKPDVLSAHAAGITARPADAAEPAPTEPVAADVAGEAPQATTEPSAPPTDTSPQALAAPVQSVAVPDLQGQSLKEAERLLEAAGLQAGEPQLDCAAIGAAATKAPKGKISCQRPAPGTLVAPGTVIDFVIADKGAKD